MRCEICYDFMKICTFLGLYIFLEISFHVTGRIGESRLGRRLSFDLKQCFFDIKLKKTFSKEVND